VSRAENILPPLEVSGVQIGSPSTTIHDSSTGLEGFGPWLGAGAATPGGRRRPYVKRKGYRVISAYLFRSCCHGRVSVPVQSKHARNCLDSHKTTATASVVDGGREGGQGQLPSLPEGTTGIRNQHVVQCIGGSQRRTGSPESEQAAREGVAGHCHVAPHASR
jgi:hypothetical protein